MGAKTMFAAAVDGDPRVALRAGTPDPAAAAALVGAWLPGRWVPGEATTLDLGIFPGDPVTALRLPGLDLLGADVLDWFEELPAQVADAVGDRRLVLHAMHSVNDSLVFAVWTGGERTRALVVDPELGVSVDEGEHLAVEVPYWAGEHPVGDDGEPQWPDDEAYPLPFHPLELGEALLSAELGFSVEGPGRDDDVDPMEIPMFGFVPAPDGPRLGRVAPTARPRRKLFRITGS